MRKWRNLTIICGSLIASPVAAIPVLQHSVEYNPQEVAWAFKAGTSSIEGQADWHWSGRRPCQTVNLIPRSTYADETFVREYGDVELARLKLGKLRGIFMSQDPRFIRDRLVARCDTLGHFAFKSIAAGTYYVNIVLGVKIYYTNGMKSNEEELVLKRVVVTDGQSKYLDLRDDD